MEVCRFEVFSLGGCYAKSVILQNDLNCSDRLIVKILLLFVGRTTLRKDRRQQLLLEL